jgi:phosphoglycolate phosphatase
MIKLVAFDWNGTLLADTISSLEGSNANRKHFGLKPISLSRYRQTFAVPISEFWLANGGTAKHLATMAEEHNRIFNSFYEPRAAKCRTRSGARALLEWLKKNHIAAAIYSNHTLSGIEAQLHRLKIRDYFDSVLARTIRDGASHVNQRSKDQKLYYYVKKKKFKPHQVLTIGDTSEEVDIGKKFGFHTVAITGGYSTASRLNAAKPDFLIHNLIDLKRIFGRLS